MPSYTHSCSKVSGDGSFFSDNILGFIEDEEELDDIDCLFGQIPDKLFTAVVHSACSECSKFKCMNSGKLQWLVKKTKQNKTKPKKYENTKHSTNMWGKTLPEMARRTNIVQFPKQLDGILQQNP